MELLWLDLKNSCNSLRIDAECSWYGWDSLSNIFLAAWIESVMTMTFDILSLEQAWLIPLLMVNSSTSVLVTNEVWWTVLVIGRFAMWICKIDVAILILMLASVITRAVWGKEELWRTILSSSWAQILSFDFSFLLTKLKEKWSEKLSIIWLPGENSELRGEKDGKIPWDLLYESMRWSLVKDFCQLVSEPILCGFDNMDDRGESFIRFLKM